MKVFIIGGTGLLGSEAARELIDRGHEVTSIALPPLPEGCELPEKMKIEFGNFLEMSDDEVRSHLKGCDAFIFAAGVDERVESPAPVYDLYRKYNIEPVKRLLPLAKESGVRHCVILGSYFSHFAKIWPEKELTKWHPYIRSRIDQENAALGFADENFDVAILELPYIFGTQPGRKPVWVFVAEHILNSGKYIMFPKGGTTMVTVRQVAQAIAGAVERNRGGNSYPIGYYNKTWKELMETEADALGHPEKKVMTIPTFLFRMYGRHLKKEQEKNNIEGGLDLSKLHDIQCSDTFIDKSEGSEKLGVMPDDIDSAIRDSMKLCLDIIEKRVSALSMKGE